MFYLRLHEHATTSLISRQSSFARNVVDDFAGGEVSSSRTSSFGSATGFRMRAPSADFSKGGGGGKSFGVKSTTACDYIGKKAGSLFFIK